MKITGKKIEVPASTRTEVVYACEEPGCDFVTADEPEVRVHHGREHAVKGQRTIGNCSFLRFDSEADFEAFVEAAANAEADEAHGNWSGPGWYGKKFGSRRCGMDCCWATTLTLLTATDVLSGWRSRAAQRAAEVEQLAELLEVSE